jgi:hypothetical protein
MNSKEVVEGLKPNVDVTIPNVAVSEIVETFAEIAPVWNTGVSDKSVQCRSDVVAGDEKVIRYKVPVTKFLRGRSLHGIYKAVSDLYENRHKSVKVDRGYAAKAPTPYHYVTVTIGWN